MEITTSVTVPDYVYLFYQKASEELQLPKTEELMARALIAYAGFISQEILSEKDST